ncbi:UNVERIFIED_CONTAM: hypothetical protein Slati_3114700 [Sesamum latifolium]|uniref:Endonuclease/exonuclease/phosphatase family protein n=1 Tax=Sesamum latifolium TaxID=2727402 RepID=A0AAW2UWC9_9LAMI
MKIYRPIWTIGCGSTGGDLAFAEDIVKMSPRPWLCAGDFNEILSQEEKTGAPRPRRQIEEF